MTTGTMNEGTVGRGRRELPVLGAALGLASGLIEGAGHMALQGLGVLDNSWYPIIWIAAVFNGLLVGMAGIAASLIMARRPERRRLYVLVVFSLFTLAVVPVLALMLKTWIFGYAIGLLIVGAAVTLTRWYLRTPRVTTRQMVHVLRWSAALTVIACVGIEGGTRLQERMATNRLAPASTKTPDVLLIVVDTLRSDHLSSYGYHRNTSPGLDALANEGLLFENSFSTSSYTLPSHASLLTGRYPRDHRVDWDTSRRSGRPSTATLPAVLQSLGYRTGAFSANTFYFTREHGFGAGFLHFEDFYHSLSDMVWRTAYGGIVTRLVRPHVKALENLPGRKLATDVSDEALAWLGEDAERPAFITLNYMDTHDPYLPPQPYRDRFSTTPNPGGRLNSKLHPGASVTGDQLQGEIDAYDGAIAYVDAQIAALLDAVRSMQRHRPLLVVVTSDHGEEFGEHGGFFHRRHLYREVIQVPLIVWEPGRVPRGVRVSQPVSNASIPATIMELLGVGASDFPAPSLLALAEGSATSPLPFSELKHEPWAYPPSAPIRVGSMRSLMDDSWHYIEQDGRAPKLFAWTTDPREAVDLAGRPDLQDVLARFAALIK